ncbi:Lactose permease [Fulvia fulva]|uniref:Lactose permease n=1 Tax=Passalora fulva TaxID=5499 RepID=A0A9Q8PGF1_PASFU|nr:Lactose permease [Fulvia fulva]UJO21961.1 Lactose permease [Fulvia fulva]
MSIHVDIVRSLAQSVQRLRLPFTSIVSPTTKMDHKDPDFQHSEVVLEKLEVPNVTWYKHAGLRRLYIMMPILFLGATTNGYDGSLLNGLQTLDPWQDEFGHPNGSTLGLFSAILQIGAFSAIFFSAYLADTFGRKKGVVIGIIVLCIGMILQVVPGKTNGMFIGGRFLVGLGSNLSQGSAPLLIMELAHPQHRGKLTVMYNTLWYVGSIVAAWTVYGTQKYTGSAVWRIPVGLQALMPVIQLVGIWLLPESPRWQVMKDKPEQALATLVKYHANGDSNDHFVQAEFQEIRDALRLDKQYAKQGWSILVKTPGNRKRLLPIALVAFFSQCSGNGLVSYYLHSILESVGITNANEQALFNGGLQIWSFLGCDWILGIPGGQLWQEEALLDRWYWHARHFHHLDSLLGRVCTDWKSWCWQVCLGHDLLVLWSCWFRMARIDCGILCRDLAIQHSCQGASIEHGFRLNCFGAESVRKSDRP